MRWTALLSLLFGSAADDASPEPTAPPPAAPQPEPYSFEGWEFIAPIALGDGTEGALLGRKGDLAIVSGEPTDIRVLEISARPHPSTVHAVDVEGDGRDEILIRGFNTSLWGLDEQPFRSVWGLDVWTAGDLNGDGLMDLIGRSDAEEIHRVWLNDGEGDFTPGPRAPDRVAGTVADLDGDGLMDVVSRVRTNARGLVWIWPGLENGGVGEKIVVPFEMPDTNRAPLPDVIADLDGDGAAEMIVSAGGSRALGVVDFDVDAHSGQWKTTTTPHLSPVPLGHSTWIVGSGAETGVMALGYWEDSLARFDPGDGFSAAAHGLCGSIDALVPVDLDGDGRAEPLLHFGETLEIAEPCPLRELMVRSAFSDDGESCLHEAADDLWWIRDGEQILVNAHPGWGAPVEGVLWQVISADGSTIAFRTRALLREDLEPTGSITYARRGDRLYVLGGPEARGLGPPKLDAAGLHAAYSLTEPIPGLPEDCAIAWERIDSGDRRCVARGEARMLALSSEGDQLLIQPAPDEDLKIIDAGGGARRTIPIPEDIDKPMLTGALDATGRVAWVGLSESGRTLHLIEDGVERRPSGASWRTSAHLRWLDDGTLRVGPYDLPPGADKLQSAGLGVCELPDGPTGDGAPSG